MRTGNCVGAMLLALAITGCGSGESEDQPPSPAQGLWVGTMSAVTGTERIVTGLVLDDNIFYFIYSRADDPALVAGVVQGTARANNGAFTSSNARDFNFDGSTFLEAAISGNYAERLALAGFITHTSGNGGFTFDTSFDPDYDSTPTIANLVGTFSGEATILFNGFSVKQGTLTVTGSGSFKGDLDGCNVTGALSPRAQGNVFNVSLELDRAPCSPAFLTLNGVAYYDIASETIYITVLNNSRANIVFFVGTKP